MRSNDIIKQALAGVSVERIRSHIQAIEGIRHPVAAPEALARAALYVRNSLAALGYDMAEQRFHDGGHEYGNILATRRGTTSPDRRVIVLAHYDTVAVTPGADDNASGVAVMLELATILQPFDFERSIQFIGVNLEENAREGDSTSGLRGSGALAAYARNNGWSIEGVVVLESVAYAGDSVVQTAPAGLPVNVPEAGNFIAVVGNTDSLDLVQCFSRTIDRYGIPLPCLTLAVPGTGAAFPDTRRSDHAPFWDNGYRAVMVTDTTNFRSPHYHQPSDTLETLDLEFAAQVCRAVGGVVMEVAGTVTPSRTRIKSEQGRQKPVIWPQIKADKIG